MDISWIVKNILLILLEFGVAYTTDEVSHPLDDKVIKTEVHEYSSVPMTTKKLGITFPEMEIHATNDGHDSHHEKELTFDFTDHKKSDYHSYDDNHKTLSHLYGYHPHHKYEYYYHYVPKRRRPTPKEVRLYHQRNQAFLSSFIENFIMIGRTRSRSTRHVDSNSTAT